MMWSGSTRRLVVDLERTSQIGWIAIKRTPVTYCILRPSIVVGRRGDGRIREFKQIYVLLRALTDGKVSAIPGEYDAVLNLVPCDHVAEAIATVACRMASVERRVMHVAAREDVSFLDFSNVLAEYPALRVPRYLGSRSFDVALLEPLEQKYYRKLVEPYGSYFTRRVRFGLGGLDCVGLKAPAGGAELLREIIAYAESARYLGRQCYA